MEILIIVLIVFYIAIFYFLKMRPEKQRKKEQEEMKRSLNPGDRHRDWRRPCSPGICYLGHHE